MALMPMSWEAIRCGVLLSILALGVGVAGGVIAAMRWHRLPWLPPRRRAPAIIAFVLGVAWFCLMVGFAVYVGTLIPRTPAG